MSYIKNYLKNNQPIIYNTIINAIKKKKIAHAYLIISNDFNDPIKDVAIYLAKSLICDNFDKNLLACENCNTCKRIENGSYLDIIIYDSEKIKTFDKDKENIDDKINLIKKEDINYIVSTFSKTTMETKHIAIYVLNLIENMTNQASNALLKFLEEPKENVYTFLTTKNISKVLPTIVSRCQILKFQSISVNKIIENYLNCGISDIDAKILAYFCDNIDFVKKLVISDMYITVKKCLDKFIENIDKKEYLLFLTDNFIIPKLINNEYITLFLNLLISVFENIIHDKKIIIYENLFNLMHNKNVYIFLFEIIKIKNNLNLNVINVLDHLAIFFIKHL